MFNSIKSHIKTIVISAMAVVVIAGAGMFMFNGSAQAHDPDVTPVAEDNSYSYVLYENNGELCLNVDAEVWLAGKASAGDKHTQGNESISDAFQVCMPYEIVVTGGSDVNLMFTKK